ncbi:MAG TPA: gephyrin-like molybdotransferase Glp [Chloroflexia bacterium]|nr:gephyrin-like molybdotransferase Glp [Chloroflexia bacterium]
MGKHNNETPLTSISVSEALQNILAEFAPLDAVAVPLAESLGLVLAEEVYSDIDIPPFDNSSMDGYALRAADLAGASPASPAALRVAGYLPAGAAPGPGDYVEEGSAFRIMTGAPMPPGADAVIPFEDTSEGRALRAAVLQPGESRATPLLVGGEVLIYRRVGPGDYIRRAGEDVRQGDLVLSKGTNIRPAEVGVLAAVGKSTVTVHRRPRVAILATGDELVDVGEMPGPGQIRNSNNYAVEAQVGSWGAEAFNLGVARDDRDHLMSKLEEALDLRPDLLVTSAGVSVGDYDFVKDVLMSLGSITMWRVRLKPGKPLAFGRLRGREGSTVPFLGLPGNPVSSMVTMELFGRPAILKMLGKSHLQRPVVMARALEALENSGGREHYIRGIVTEEGGEYVARTTGKQESNILTSMSRANAFLVVGEETRRIEVGELVRAMLLDE